ncbi:AAA family ATPase [Dyadobacter sp. OTU695]|uniref:AAA family ATPase n=1 Tax=Dyadobacter sp. OTU695 TaxID=3043860 RepID=UPI00313C4C56
MTTIAGRQDEQAQMRQLLQTGKSEFLAVLGRRRVGKTFLIRNVYQKELVFQMTGIAHANMAQQLANFASALRDAEKKDHPVTIADSWFVAFEHLKAFLTNLKGSKKVVFFDELPWIDTPKSQFLSSLEHFWNSWASTRADIVLVVCGSAASWMLNKLINNRGGLHNRVTRQIRLEPFTLKETEHFLQISNVNLDRYQIIQLYMAMGGIPFYLNEVQPGLSAFQIIDKTCFTKGGLLSFEYDNLYHSLFSKAERHIAIIEALASKPQGLTRDEIIQASRLLNGGTLTTLLQELEESGFISKSYPFEKKIKTSLYRLTDQYSLFYLKFIKNKKVSGSGTWMSRIDSPTWRAWSGYAYENIVLAHIANVKKALGISGIYTETSSWVSARKEAQIDLLIDRRDHVISICEIKFSQTPFIINKQYKAELERKLAIFKSETKSNKSAFLTMITTFGAVANSNSLGLVQNQVTMDDLFH